MIENNYPRRYLRLASPKATSDDELDPAKSKVRNKRVHLINVRPERSKKATRFLRKLDIERENQARLDPSKTWRERPRRERPEGSKTVFTAFPGLPLNMPIDYFKPEFFNKLTPTLRAKAGSYHVAFLPNIEDSLSLCDDECLSDADFDKKYADACLAQYKMVNQADLVYIPPQLNAEMEDRAEEGYEADGNGDDGGDDAGDGFGDVDIPDA